MSTGVHGHGATLKVCATTAFTTVTTFGQITSIGGPNQKRDSIEISNLGSSAKWREFINGMLDAGDLSCDVVYDGSTEATAMKAQLTNDTAYWKVTFYDAAVEASRSSIYCAGFVTELGHQIPFDDKISQSVTIKLTGAPVFAPKT